MFYPRNKVLTIIIFKKERVCRDIKTKKAQEQDWDSILATKLN